MTDQASKFIGSIPENYDTGLGPILFYEYAADLAARVAACNPKSVLELASGTGIVTRRMRNVLPGNCRITASDLNRPMLDVAKNKFEAGENVGFEVIDANEIAIDNSSVDVVVCQFGVMFFPDKERSFAEVKRVIKPGGSYIFNVWDSWEKNSFARITNEVVEMQFPSDPPGFYRVPFSYCDAERIKSSLIDAGFGNVKIEYKSVTSPIPSISKFAHGLVFGNPLYDEILNRGGEPDDTRVAVEEALKREFDGGISLRALVFEAS